LLGIESDESISVQRLLAAIHPDDRDRCKEAIAQVLDADRGRECYLEFRTAGPSERWLAASGRAFFEGMRVVRVAGTLQEVTEQKRTEEKREARLGELGHDLRLPLSAISMGIQLVQRDVPEKGRILSSMHALVQRMDRLIHQLLRVAGSGTGELVLKRERVPLAGICREAVDEALLAHPDRIIEFQGWDDALGEWDRDRVLQVVRNLLSNALTHGAEGEPVIVSVVDCKDEALLVVFNRGQPVPDRFREQLLDPTRREGWSSGHLGLGIVKEIVRAHGGRIELISDQLATLFHIWLPKKAREEGGPALQASRSGARAYSRRPHLQLSKGAAS
jgi:sigma-B regulation protein RsbU (phosphoserine phosphatase)